MCANVLLTKNDNMHWKMKAATVENMTGFLVNSLPNKIMCQVSLKHF